MYNKVMWATDGSEAADRALVHAKSLAAASATPLLVVYCEEFMVPAKGGGSLPVHANEAELRAKIEHQIAEIGDNGTSATLEITRSMSGGAAHAIAEIAAREHADLIVVGTRGHTPLVGLLLGGVTQRLLHIAPCPVLAVPPDRNGTG
ncbi:MAG TPA: universal stress protein [Solirubrobacteraceae bacterium]|nr:universal stress protein [Solirubrobacteraceae bacterium]